VVWHPALDYWFICMYNDSIQHTQITTMIRVKTKVVSLENTDNNILAYQNDVNKIKAAIVQSRYWTAANANLELLSLYYSVGDFVSLNTRSGKWGTGAVETISKMLQSEIPGLRGFSPSNMKNMRMFYEQWSSNLDSNCQLSTGDLSNNETINILVSNRQLPTGDLSNAQISAFRRVGFTHHIEILTKCKIPDERWYYILRCADEFWTVANLKHHIRNGDYSSFGNMPNNFSLTIPDDRTAAIAVRSFRDDYLLDYTNIRETDDYDEQDVENAIAANVKKFIMTAGEGFSFIGNQYRLLVDNEEFYIDLLFYERNLQCLVAFELKKEKFRPADLGQLSFYLSALDKFVRKPHENKSIGILLCQDMNRTVVELAVQDYDKPLGVATYRLNTGIPEQYTSLVPLIDGVQQILSNNE